MITQRFDTIVVGVGGMGSAAVYHLAKRGQKVLGLERFDVPNDMGSSHGVTRIIRLAYYEHPSYVPLLQRAYTLWEELEKLVDEQLLYTTGSIDAGPPDGFVFAGSLRSCQLHGLPHEVLTSADLSRRFPGYRLPSETMALLQPRGGFLLPERCIVAHVVAAQALGAEVHGREQVLEWSSGPAGVKIHTTRGDYEAERLIITAGAWAGQLIPALAKFAVPERQVLAWFQPSRPELFGRDRFPVFNLQVEEGRYYGFPIFGVPGFKVGRYHHWAEAVDPDRIDRDIHSRDEAVLREFTAKYMPDALGPILTLKVCMFTNSPDEHFILDRLPGDPNVVVGAGFSGHGFKFCSVVGEVLADIATTGNARLDIEILRLERLLREAPANPDLAGLHDDE
jgi:sarcosine oxidase